MMAFKEIIEQINDRKNNGMKFRSLLFAYGPVIYEKSLAQADPSCNEKILQHSKSFVFLEEEFLLPIHFVLILIWGEKWNYLKFMELLSRCPKTQTISHYQPILQKPPNVMDFDTSL